jgi:hypothetical protein
MKYNNMHEHKKCEHKKITYCEKCDVWYCPDCKKEWEVKFSTSTWTGTGTGVGADIHYTIC